MPPFVNMSGDAENEYFADGITEEIIDVLAQITDLQVGGRRSAFCFKGRHIDPRIVGEQLNVRTVLEGSVRQRVCIPIPASARLSNTWGAARG
jgi:adenylate cyclase